MESWGWRIPFLVGLVVGFAGYLLRRHLRDTGLSKHERSPVVETFRSHGALLARLAASRLSTPSASICCSSTS
jgi:MHS family proline/betaine transporter-like MFS transporter